MVQEENVAAASHQAAGVTSVCRGWFYLSVFLSFFLFFFLGVFLGLHLQHMEVIRLGVE